MKRMLIAMPLLVMLFALVFVAPANATTTNVQREETVVEFNETVKLSDVLLRGQYLIYHDDSRMAEGEACLYIYSMKAGKRDKLVAAIHCEPVERNTAKQFTVTFSPRSTQNAIREVREIQFAGFAKAHRIPS
jgi:hypothetical protein